MGIPYVPTLGFAGSDVIGRRDDFTIMSNPFNPQEQFVVAKAINPDVAIFHGLKGDRIGNVLLRDRGDELMLGQASRKVIVTVEEVVDRVDPKDSAGNFMPAIHVTAVAHAPMGAHPTAAPGYYDADEEELRAYVEASCSDESFQKYLQRHVFEHSDHAGYLTMLGLGSAYVAVAP